MKTYEDIINHFGTMAALAKELDISRQAVHDWKGIIPKSRCYHIELITKGKFNAQGYIDKHHPRGVAA